MNDNTSELARNFSGNSTTARAADHGVVGVLTGITIVTFTTGTLANGCLLVVFAVSPSLRAVPFNVYLINLLTANLVDLLIQFPMDIATRNDFMHNWYLGDPLCDLYYGAMWVSQVLHEEGRG